MPSEEVYALAEKIFNSSAGRYPRIINKKVKDYEPADVAAIFTMLAELSQATADAIESNQLVNFTDTIDLSGLLMDAIKNNCSANLISLAKLKQYLLMKQSEEN
jgi:hypothetical protein